MTTPRIIPPVITYDAKREGLRITPDPTYPIFYKLLKTRFWRNEPKGESFYLLPDNTPFNNFLKRVANIFNGRIEQPVISFVREPPLCLIYKSFSSSDVNARPEFLSGEEGDLLLIINDFFGEEIIPSPEDQEDFYNILKEYLTGKKGDLDLNLLNITETDFYQCLTEDLGNKEPKTLIKDPRMLIILNYLLLAYKDWVEKRARKSTLSGQETSPSQEKQNKDKEGPLARRIGEAKIKRAMELYYKIKGYQNAIAMGELSDDKINALLLELSKLGFNNFKDLETFLRENGLLEDK